MITLLYKITGSMKYAAWGIIGDILLIMYFVHLIKQFRG